MSEVDAHYAASGGKGASHGQAPEAASRPLDTARSALDQATATAKDGLKAVSGQAKATTDAIRDTAGGAYDKASDWGRTQYGSASRKVTDASRRSAAGLSKGRRGVEAFVDENPVMVGVVGLAAGLLIGALLPGTRHENRLIGPYADEARDQGLRYARELAEQGKRLVEDSIDATVRPADRDTGDETRAM